MRAVWHIVRVVCLLCLAGAAITVAHGLFVDDPWVMSATMSLAYSAGLVLPLYMLWRLLVLSTQRLRS